MVCFIDEWLLFMRHPNRPFSLKVFVAKDAGITNIVGIERAVFEHHYHEDDGKSRTQAKREMKETITRLEGKPHSQESVEYSDKLDGWLQRALVMSSAERKRLRDIEKSKRTHSNIWKGARRKSRGTAGSICLLGRSATYETGKREKLEFRPQFGT